MQKLTFLLLCTFVINLANAQQEYWFSIFNESAQTQNPGFTGFKYSNRGFVGYQMVNQITTTSLFSYDQRIGDNGLAFGLNLTFDESSMTSEMQSRSDKIKINGAKRIEFGSNTLNVGVSIGVHHKRLNIAEWNPFDPNDPALPPTNTSIFRPEFDLGLVYSGDKFLISMSSTQLGQLNFDGLGKNVRHYFVYGNYNFSLNDNISLIPSLAMLSDGSKIGPEFTLLAQIDKIGVGLNARRNNIYGLVATYELKERFKLISNASINTGENAINRFYKFELGASYSIR